MEYRKIHTSFQLHETSFVDGQSLIDFVASISEESASFLKEWFDEKSFVVVQTSGSTGVPKKIKLNN